MMGGGGVNNNPNLRDIIYGWPHIEKVLNGKTHSEYEKVF